VKLADLPQGVVSSDVPPLQDAKNEPAYPTVVLQARMNMQKFDNCVLLTRVGGFYELYFEHAEEYGPLLNLKVASKKTSAGAVPMVRRPRGYILRQAGDTRADTDKRLVFHSSSWIDFLRSWCKI
jgi:hypothetical protein